ncbi:hypothetical protein ACU4HD_43835 [Cupriavidus basilensis]
MLGTFSTRNPLVWLLGLLIIAALVVTGLVAWRRGVFDNLSGRRPGARVMTTRCAPGALVATFNSCGRIRYIDASWLPADLAHLRCATPPVTARQGAPCWRGRCWKAHRLQGEWDYDFAAVEKRIALLPADALERLARRAAAFACIASGCERAKSRARHGKPSIWRSARPLVAFALERMPAFEAVAETLQAAASAPRLAVESAARARGRRDD